MPWVLLVVVLLIAIVAVIVLMMTDNESETNTNAVASNVNTPSPTNVSVTNTANETPDTGSPNNEVTISVTSTHATPSSVTLSAPAFVIWVNDASGTISIAPDVHPTHEKYAGIWDDDGSGEIDPGEMYSFTFSQPGTYTWHDHLNETVTGTVIVE